MITFAAVNEKLSHLLDQVRSIFTRFGVKSVTMDDLCRELSISKKTLYQFVCDKSDLVQKTMKYEIRQDQQEINSILEQHLPAIDELFEITRKVGEKLRHLHPSILYDIQKYYPEAWEIMTQHRSGYIVSVIKKNILKGQDEGVYRHDLNPEIIAMLFTSKIELLANHSLSSQLNAHPLEINQQNLIYHIRGISNQTGLKSLETKLSSINPTLYEK